MVTFAYVTKDLVECTNLMTPCFVLYEVIQTVGIVVFSRIVCSYISHSVLLVSQIYRGVELKPGVRTASQRPRKRKDGVHQVSYTRYRTLRQEFVCPEG